MNRWHAAVAGAVTGYALGRARPLEEARRRTMLTLRFGRPDHRPLGLRHLVAWSVLHPARGARVAWRTFARRREQPEEREPVSLSEVFRDRPAQEG